jgi:hypothetical protein
MKNVIVQHVRDAKGTPYATVAVAVTADNKLTYGWSMARKTTREAAIYYKWNRRGLVGLPNWDHFDKRLGHEIATGRALSHKYDDITMRRQESDPDLVGPYIIPHSLHPHLKQLAARAARYFLRETAGTPARVLAAV